MEFQKSFENLKQKIDTRDYRNLTECVLAQTIIFNRKRMGDVQFLKIDTKNYDTTNQES